MKAEGIEYEERMELLEEVTYPQPLAELLEPRVRVLPHGPPLGRRPRAAPKSVARDLSERAMTFTEYVGFYGLARSEGLVLRYLADAYKALRQTVPEARRGPRSCTDLTEWLGELVRQVDSSLLDEWERLTSPDGGTAAAPVRREAAGRHRNARAFRVLVRNAMFRRVELAALRRHDLLGELDADAGWDAGWAEALAGYFEEHD